MPLLKINILKGLSDSEKELLHQAVHEALKESINILDRDLHQRICEYSKTDMKIPPDRSEKYILIEVYLFKGRSKEAKGKLYSSLANKLTGLGFPKEDIMTVILEEPLENWGIKGGQRADQVELGFNVKV